MARMTTGEEFTEFPDSVASVLMIMFIILERNEEHFCHKSKTDFV
jgi:hypothetical protein